MPAYTGDKHSEYQKERQNIDVLIETVCPDIILGTETWLSDERNTVLFPQPTFSIKVWVSQSTEVTVPMIPRIVIFIIGGDFNMPDIDWDKNTVMGGSRGGGGAGGPDPP